MVATVVVVAGGAVIAVVVERWFVWLFFITLISSIYHFKLAGKKMKI